MSYARSNGADFRQQTAVGSVCDCARTGPFGWVRSEWSESRAMHSVRTVWAPFAQRRSLSKHFPITHKMAVKTSQSPPGAINCRASARARSYAYDCLKARTKSSLTVGCGVGAAGSGGGGGAGSYGCYTAGRQLTSATTQNNIAHASARFRSLRLFPPADSEYPRARMGLAHRSSDRYITGARLHLSSGFCSVAND